MCSPQARVSADTTPHAAQARKALETQLETTRRARQILTVLHATEAQCDNVLFALQLSVAAVRVMAGAGHVAFVPERYVELGSMAC